VKFSVELPAGAPERIVAYAAAIEAAGFDACYVTDHPAPPRAWLEQGGHATVDPFVALSFAAAATSTVLLHTHCLIPAYRDPLLCAKAVATLDAMSGGRVLLGVAVGYLEAEFAAVGVPFAERPERFDAALRTMKAAWSGDLGAIEVLPRPRRQPHPPIWVGGNSQAAMRRAIEHGRGWAPFPASPRTAAAVGTTGIPDADTLGSAITRFRALCADAGRDPDAFDICFTSATHPAHKDVADPDAFVAEARALRDLGVSWLTLHLPFEAIGGFGAAVNRVHA
jgi:probable F420-dependent oxidoreductase